MVCRSGIWPSCRGVTRFMIRQRFALNLKLNVISKQAHLCCCFNPKVCLHFLLTGKSCGLLNEIWHQNKRLRPAVDTLQGHTCLFFRLSRYLFLCEGALLRENHNTSSQCRPPLTLSLCASRRPHLSLVEEPVRQLLMLEFSPRSDGWLTPASGLRSSQLCAAQIRCEALLLRRSAVQQAPSLRWPAAGRTHS